MAWKPTDDFLNNASDDVPPGARWITEEMYEVDGELHFTDPKGYDRPKTTRNCNYDGSATMTA